MVNWAEQCLHFFDENGAPKRPIDPQTDKAVKDARDARENADAMPWDDVRCIYRGQSMVDFDKKYYQQLRDKLTVDIEETENALQTDENEYHDLIRGTKNIWPSSRWKNLGIRSRSSGRLTTSS
jgi:hypothetical protein